MKLLISFLLLLSANAKAVDICSFEETWNFVEALETDGIKAHKTSKNHKRFTFVEKQMIHFMVTQQSWMEGISREEALENFGDFYNGKMGFNAGEIVYYQIDGKEIALVHYWPGDNEVGAFFEMRNGAYKIIATVSDAWISCK